ncbi:MAG: hypothetical protein M1830_002319, partial [Pleopsidium flavum]
MAKSSTKWSSQDQDPRILQRRSTTGTPVGDSDDVVSTGGLQPSWQSRCSLESPLRLSTTSSIVTGTSKQSRATLNSERLYGGGAAFAFGMKSSLIVGTGIAFAQHFWLSLSSTPYKLGK